MQVLGLKSSKLETAISAPEAVAERLVGSFEKNHDQQR
jgi:hypothetical protein